MSRVGSQPVQLPEKVSVEQAGGRLTVKGPKGSLEVHIPKGVSCSVEDGTVTFDRDSEDRTVRAKHGLARALLANAVHGVHAGYERRLQIVGVGYRAASQGKNVQLTLGYSHPVDFEVPEGIEVAVEDNTKLVVRGIDKQAVGQVAADIRALRPPDAYKGKGVRFADEVVRLKAGKAGAR